MAKLVVYGKEVGGGSADFNIIKKTQAEYNAMSEEEKKNGTYLITDAVWAAAKDISYDGSESGLGDNVQDAIDGLSGIFNTSGLEHLAVWGNTNRHTFTFKKPVLNGYSRAIMVCGWYTQNVQAIPIMFDFANNVVEIPEDTMITSAVVTNNNTLTVEYSDTMWGGANILYFTR